MAWWSPQLRATAAAGRPLTVFHAEITEAVDQGGLPSPQTTDPRPKWIPRPGRAAYQAPARRWPVFTGVFKTSLWLLCLCPLTMGSPWRHLPFLLTLDVHKACLWSLFNTADSQAPPQSFLGPGPRNLH